MHDLLIEKNIDDANATIQSQKRQLDGVTGELARYKALFGKMVTNLNPDLDKTLLVENPETACDSALAEAVHT